MEKPRRFHPRHRMKFAGFFCFGTGIVQRMQPFGPGLPIGASGIPADAQLRYTLVEQSVLAEKVALYRAA